MSRLPHFLDSWLEDGGEVVSFTRRPHFAPWKIPGTHFGWRLSRSQGIVRLEGLGNPTRDLPACSVVPQPAALPRLIVVTLKKCIPKLWINLSDRLSQFSQV
jgi:hypothetical protein